MAEEVAEEVAEEEATIAFEPFALLEGGVEAVAESEAIISFTDEGEVVFTPEEAVVVGGGCPLAIAAAVDLGGAKGWATLLS